MIRRLLVMVVLALGILFIAAASANASGRDIACAYNRSPLNVGLCIGL
jgi:hypothetical protein